MKKNWWKWLILVLVAYAFPFAFLGEVSVQILLHETIRNLYFHVTMWFSMFIMLIISMVYAVKFLSSSNLSHDLSSKIAAQVATLFGMIGIVTGMVWANNTWGKPWVDDPQLNSSAITMIAYFAYFILRDSIKDENKKARIGAVYNLFAFVLMFILLGILPRINNSLHPGKGGNPGFGSYDLAPTMRPVFYTCIIIWTLVGVWIFTIQRKFEKAKKELN